MKMRMVIHLVCGARPNFMKVAPLYHALTKESWARPVIVHTGQHYDHNMSDGFFDDLGLPPPDISLSVGSSTHAEQTAMVMMLYEKVLLDHRPDIVVVVGDVNSTMAAALAASKLGVKVAHLEAGLRSFDREMPEEINRLVTDVLSDVLWAPSRDAVQNLINEGISRSKVSFVGNIMIDSLEMLREKIESQRTFLDYRLRPRTYGVVTLHRPSNVDDAVVLAKACDLLTEISQTVPLIFPIHPRTRRQLAENHLLATIEKCSALILPEPLSYIRFMSLVFNCAFVITDSGGIQEETTYLGIPCLTLRANTERPITVTQGTNRLCDLDDLKVKIQEILNGQRCKLPKIELWDGNTAARIVSGLRDANNERRRVTSLLNVSGHTTATTQSFRDDR